MTKKIRFITIALFLSLLSIFPCLCISSTFAKYMTVLPIGDGFFNLTITSSGPTQVTDNATLKDAIASKKSYTVNGGSYYSVITADGENVDVTINNNASLNSPNANLLLIVNGGSMTIENANNDASAGISALANVKDGTLIIEDGNYNVQYIAYGNQGGTVEIRGGNFILDNFNGGTGFLANFYPPVGSLIITGGTFNKNPSDYVPSGYAVVENADRTYTVVSQT